MLIPIDMCNRYFGPSKHLLLFLGVLLLFVLFSKKIKYSKYLFVYTICFFFIYYFPVTAKIIVKCIGEVVYWRMLWLLFLPISVCYAVVALVRLCRKKFIQWILVTAFIIVVIATGFNLYGYEMFSRAENMYKLPQYVIDACDIIKKDSEIKKIEQPNVFPPNEFLCYIRQYDADLHMIYGRRYGEKYEDYVSIWDETYMDQEKMRKIVDEEDIDYIIVPKAVENLPQFFENDFSNVGEIEDYYVLYNEK